MPKHRGIRMSLISQYDAKKIPEYREANDQSPATANAVNVSIPVYPSSQFWIRYSCHPPSPGSDTRFFYFKLYVDGEFKVAWGCGSQDKWKGEMVFIPNEARPIEPLDSGKRPLHQRLGLFFPRRGGANGHDPTFEIHVYRAKARKREQRQYAVEDTAQAHVEGICMKAIGVLKKQDPQRFYTYALVDQKDEPYTAFRYHCRKLANPDDLRKHSSKRPRQDTQSELPRGDLVRHNSIHRGGRSLSEALAKSIKRRFSMTPKTIAPPNSDVPASSALLQGSPDGRDGVQWAEPECDPGIAAREHQDAGDQRLTVRDEPDRVAKPLASADATSNDWKATVLESALALSLRKSHVL
ncbi:hypothetical protein Q7P37_003975 [Cladosporium fusiforme]